MTEIPLDAAEAEFRATLTACLAVPRWVDDVLAGRPYVSLDDLVDRAHGAATPLSPTEVDQAMAHHPRIGERPEGEGLSQQLSRHEQSTSSALDGGLSAELAEGNRAYEARFDRVFLIRAAGRSRPEILSELHRRLELDPETELGIVAAELGDIALLRLRQLFTDPVSGSTS